MGQEITIQLALRQKPAAFSVLDPKHGILYEALVEALNAVRFFGHSQLLVSLRSTYPDDKWNEDGADEKDLTNILDIIEGMQLKEGEIEFFVTPNSPEERSAGRFCRIDLRLKK